MAEASSTWMIPKSTGPVDPNEKLFVFGYSCKIFPYDDKATYIDKGKHLIPWMGDKNLMIDRYDVRGYLHDLKQYEPKPGGYDDSSEEEKLIDEERYRSLRTDMTEQQLYQEEELKRLRAAIAGDGAYHEIGFTYDNPENEEQSEPVAIKAESPDDELYKVPEGLKIPKEMEVPYNMKIHAIIEKTAVFVSEQGGQMEIIIKMKQHANPQFAFMHLDNPLYPYYKHLVQEIKSGAYKPIQARRVSRSEDEDDDGHYLHPSLLSGKANAVPKFTVPTINFRRSDDDSYALLVKNLQQHVVEETAPEPEQNTFEGSGNNLSLENSNYDVIHNHHIVPPPPDIQPIVNKMAEYVAKNGEDFEIIVKSKNDKRFDFLHPWHEYYNYYIYKRNVARHEIHGTDVPNAQNISVAHSEEKPQVEENNSSNMSTENNQDSTENNQNSTENNQNSSENCSTFNTNSETLPVSNISNDEDDYLGSQTSQDSVFDLQESSKKDSSNSSESPNSPSNDAVMKDESKTKVTKVIKGPISFSLKVKETEIPTEKPKLTPLLLDDSDEDCSEESHTQKDNVEDTVTANQPKIVAVEPKAPKQIDEAMETKLAEERIKDKLLATARERLAQQRKEKQQELEQQMRAEQQKKEKQQLLDQQRKEKELQLERKRKAALFLKMLKRKSPDLSSAVPTILKTEKNREGKELRQSPDFWCLPDTSTINSDNGILFPVDKIIISTQNPHSSIIPGIKTDWSPAQSESSAVEDPLSRIADCPNTDADSPKIVSSEQSRKKKRKRKSRSRSRGRSRRSSKSSRRTKDKDKCRSKSPPRHYKSEKTKREKEKQLPAAYADVDNSRSRSRSPKRYRSVPKWRRR